MKETYKKKLQGVSEKLGKLFQKQRQMVADEIDMKRRHLAEAVTAAASNTGSNASTAQETAAKAPINLAEVMLQKKIKTLTKQLEVADQKSRYVTMQWQADKARFKDMLDMKKSEMDDLMNRLIVMEVKCSFKYTVRRSSLLDDSIIRIKYDSRNRQRETDSSSKRAKI